MVLVEVVAEPMSLVPLVVMQMEKFEGKERALEKTKQKNKNH